MSHVHDHFPSDVLSRIDAHISGRGFAVEVAVSGHQPVGEALVRAEGEPTGVTIACVDGRIGINRHAFDADGSLAGVQLGLLRPTSDVGGILSDLDDRLAARPLARGIGPVFAATSVILSRLGELGVATKVGERPDWDVPFEIDRIRLLDADGDPCGVEVVVAENASWVRSDGEDGPPVDHDQAEDIAEAALALARPSAPGM